VQEESARVTILHDLLSRLRQRPLHGRSFGLPFHVQLLEQFVQGLFQILRELAAGTGLPHDIQHVFKVLYAYPVDSEDHYG
jgi:hypothetical protein